MTEPRGLLLSSSGEPFATGTARYLDAHPEIRDPLSRIYVEFLPEGADISFLALLDTGAQVAELGDPLGFEATVFVSPDWQGPCFIGYAGALDRLCFAVHPRDNRFYFGPLE